MQRASSALEFSNLLNPAGASPAFTSSSPTDSIPRSQNMAAAVSALPGANMSALSATEKPADLPRPYKCPLCEKAFHRLEHQTRHIRTHTGEKPHGCHYPGCTKRFSRSDELTRHSRIHNNPHSRRNNKGLNSMNANASAAVVSYAQDRGMMPPPRSVLSQSAPSSNTSSPNVSPPHSYSQYGASMAAAYPRHHTGDSPVQSQRNPLDINLLANAADAVERDSAYANHYTTSKRFSNPHPANMHQQHSFPSNAPRTHPSSLSAYALSSSVSSTSTTSPSLSRAQSPSRHSILSPHSTAPSSPSFSQDSMSSTPEHTPLATPAHSPRLRPFGVPSVLQPSSSNSSISHMLDSPAVASSPNGVQLPGLRHLSLGTPPGLPSLSTSPQYGLPMQQAPALAVMEPGSHEGSGPPYIGGGNNGSNASSPYGSFDQRPAFAPGSHPSRLSEILRSSEGSQRKLPVPKLAVSDLLSNDAMDER